MTHSFTLNSCSSFRLMLQPRQINSRLRRGEQRSVCPPRRLNATLKQTVPQRLRLQDQELLVAKFPRNISSLVFLQTEQKWRYPPAGSLSVCLPALPLVAFTCLHTVVDVSLLMLETGECSSFHSHVRLVLARVALWKWNHSTGKTSPGLRLIWERVGGDLGRCRKTREKGHRPWKASPWLRAKEISPSLPFLFLRIH